MSRKSKPYPRKPRSKHTDTMALATHFAARLTPVELHRIRTELHAHFEQLRSGTASLKNFAGVCTACQLGNAIEVQGVVRGLKSTMQSAESVLLGIQRRAAQPAGWTAPTLDETELHTINELLDLHLFQLAQLSYGEYRAAWRLMVGRVTSDGGELIKGDTL